MLERILPRAEPATSPQRLSARLSALKLMSLVAARMGKVDLARQSIGRSLALWDELKLENRLVHRIRSMDEWERWSRSYLAETER